MAIVVTMRKRRRKQKIGSRQVVTSRHSPRFFTTTRSKMGNSTPLAFKTLVVKTRD
jgi:hypothetical protein